MATELIELKRRLERTERQTRALFLLVLLTAGGALTLASRPAMTQTEGTTVKAPLKVVDNQGRLLVLIDGDADGGGIAILNAKGRAEMSFSSSDNGGVLQIHNNLGGNVIYLGATPEGGEINVVGNQAVGAGLAVLSARYRGAQLELSGPGGKGTMAVGKDSPAGWGRPSLAFRSNLDGTYVSFGPHRDHKGQFRFVGNYSSSPARDPGVTPTPRPQPKEEARERRRQKK